MTPYRSGLVWLSILVVLPLVLIAALLLGAMPAETTLLRLTSGIFAYGWMLCALFIAGKPSWLKTSSALLAQGALLIASLPLGLGHTGTNTLSGWSSLTGGLALVSLFAAGIYSGLYWLSTRLPKTSISPRLIIWLNRANALACGLVFIHVQLIPSIRHNLPFMLAFYLVTAVAFVSYFRKKADATTEETTEQTELV